jgi:glycosyltransferase involved in cell wall biosynthesis
VEPLEVPYLLVSIIPYFVDDDDRVWLDRLWHRDLVEHTSYLRRLTVAAPRVDEKPTDAVLLDDDRIRFVPLPAMRSLKDGVKKAPRLARALWSAVGDAHVVHSSVVGWPYPIGWVANLIALLRKKKLFIVVESAPWRTTSDVRARPVERVRAKVTEALARAFIERSDLAVFTHDGYRETLGGGARGHVIPASWIHDDDVLDDDAARESWRRKGERVRVLFAGRFVEQKGVLVLLEAARALEARGADVQIEFLGDGALVELVKSSVGPRVTWTPPVPYGPALFERVRAAHAVVVPTISDEQPRILYDAAAQAVPVIGTDTVGNRAFVRSGENGVLVPPADASALAQALATPRERLEELGLRALADVRGHTLRAMHHKRRAALRDHLA